MDASIDLELMTTSLALTMGMKLFFFLFAAISIHFLLAWMDKRSTGGFKAWRLSVMTNDTQAGTVMLGVYYSTRFAVLYAWAALLFSS